MTEKLLQFIWQFGYFNSANLLTTADEKLSIIFPGTLNKNAGPDFTGAKIKIGDTVFFGNIELHLQTTDWEKHHHQTDDNYRGVVLHVVFKHNKDIHNSIPVLELEPRISSLLLERYRLLMDTDRFIPCGNTVSTVNELVWSSWKERLLAERLTRKAERIFASLKESNNHWEEVLWWLLARNFGMKVNSDAFEAIAKSVSIKILAKHKASIHQIEALLFGQAGLLEGEMEKDYPKMLQQEYHFLQKKLALQPIAIPLQFLRMRPGNFPTIRLAQLAVLIQQASHLFSKILEAEDIKEIKNLFSVTANDYWHYHYTFHEDSNFKKKTLGVESIDSIIINTVIPVLFAYGFYHGEERYKEKALQWLEEIGTEKNSIIKGFAQLKISSNSAYDSQALIELKNEYCFHKRCLQCSIGNAILKREVLQTVSTTNPARL